MSGWRFSRHVHRGVHVIQPAVPAASPSVPLSLVAGRPAPIRFAVRGEPVTQGSKRAFANKYTGRAQVVETNQAKLRPWQADVKVAAVEAYGARQPLEGPVSVVLRFYVSRPKSQTRAERANPWRWQTPDADKLQRAVHDAMRGVLYKDDAQICHTQVTKKYAEGDHLPGVEVLVWSLKKT